MPKTNRSAAFLSGLMFFSGAAALIYEIVWLRMLTRAFGVSVYAVSFLVGLFFAGLVLGSLAASRWTRKEADWLSVYAGLEVAGAACAVLATVWMGRLPDMVAAVSRGLPAQSLLADTVLRFLLGGPALIVPTFFFGATMPVLIRFWDSRLEDAGRSAGLLYGANTLGAMTGSAAAGFITIAWLGESGSVAVAVALNLAAAGAALAMRPRGAPGIAGQFARILWGKGASVKRSVVGPVCWLYAASGFCAIGYEVLWTRRLTTLFGNSIYAFTLFLLVYLGGTAIGSAVIGMSKHKDKDPWSTFGRLQILLAVMALVSLAMSDSLGLALIHPKYLYSPLMKASDLITMFVQGLIVVFPPAFVMGCLFPLAARLQTTDARGAASSVGLIYAFNTAGGIAGSLLTGFILIGLLGSQKAFALLAIINVAVGLAALSRSGTRILSPTPNRLLILLFIMTLAVTAEDKTLEVLSRRLKGASGQRPEILFHEEGAAGTATGVKAWGTRVLLINGIVTAAARGPGELMVGMPQMMIPHPPKMLIVGVGAGASIAAAASLGGEVLALDLLKPVVDNVTLFMPGKEDLFTQSNVTIKVADGRNYLLRTEERFDVVLVDASPPLFSAGTVNLYTVEFLEIVRRRLTPEGIFVMWLPTGSFEEDYWRILSGFARVFPHLKIWNHERISDGFLIFASDRVLSWAPETIPKAQRELAQPLIARNVDGEALIRGFQLEESALRDFVKDIDPVTDDHPYTEFPLGKLLRGERPAWAHSFLKKASGRTALGP